MQVNREYYIYCGMEELCLPDKTLLKLRQLVLDRIRVSAPHLLHKVKRFMPNQTISWIDALKNTKAYPFSNGDQPETRKGVVWTDYRFFYWPLLLALLRLHPDKTYKDVVSALITDNRHDLNWERLLQLLPQKNTAKRLIQTDELDRWYDEISITHLKPDAYHVLYSWFGDEVREIGYNAFDFFMKERDRKEAWHKALKKQMQTITQLPYEFSNRVLVSDLLPLVQIA